MEGTGCERAPEYCNGGAIAGIAGAPRGMAPDVVTAEAVVGDGCVTGEAYVGKAGCCGAEVCG